MVKTMLAIAAVAALALRRSLVEVAGRSMEPTLWPGDRLLTAPVSRRLLRHGTVVVLRDPNDNNHLVIKRISRISGDRVEVLGDDPGRSTDSRAWGTVDLQAIRRIAIARWPDIRTPIHHRRRGTCDRTTRTS